MTTEHTQIPETYFSATDAASDLTNSFTVINNKLQTVIRCTTGESISDRDIVAFNGLGEIVKAQAGDSGRMPFIGVALESGASGVDILVQIRGIVDLTPFEMNVGVVQFVSGNAAGELEDTFAGISGYEANIVGFSLNKNILMIIG